MKTKFYLLVTTLLLHAGIALGDIYTDPATNVNYEYNKSANSAIVKAGGGTSAGSPDVAGSVTILSSITVDGKTYTVNEIGKEAFYRCEKLESIFIPPSIKTINESAFYDCKGLTTINVPNSEIAFKRNSFYNCLALKVINISDLSAWCSKMEFDDRGANPLIYAHRLYQNGVEIKDLKIPSGVTTINGYAFYCGRFNSVYIPSSVTKINYNAFSSCETINSVEITSVSQMSNAFAGTLIKKLYTSNINWILSLNEPATEDYSHFMSRVEHLFVNGEEVHDIVIDNIKTIRQYAFFGFKGLKSLKIGNSVQKIEQYVFTGCSNLASVEMGNSVTYIGNSAFQSCVNLMPIVIPNSVETIGKNAFYGSGIYNSQPDGVYYVDNWACGYKGEATENSEFVVKEGTIGISVVPNVGFISIPASVKHISNAGTLTNLKKLYVDGQSNFDALSLTQRYYGAKDLTTVILGNEITTIKNEKFMGLKNLKTVIMGYGLREIGQQAFSSCESLEKVRIPNGVTTIGREAFSGCKNMTTLTIPNSVTSFGAFAFLNCLGLVSVNALMNVPKAIDESVFSSNNGYGSRTIYYIATLYVPRGRTAIYQNVSAWKLFSNIQEKDVTYELTYILDGEVYKSMEIQPGITITPEGDPVKDGMVFSGWRTVPAEMPDHDVVVYGWFEPYTSGIGELTQDKKNGVDTWYTINGLRLSSKPSKAGIYIHRGKKVIIR